MPPAMPQKNSQWSEVNRLIYFFHTRAIWSRHSPAELQEDFLREKYAHIY